MLPDLSDDAGGGAEGEPGKEGEVGERRVLEFEVDRDSLPAELPMMVQDEMMDGEGDVRGYKGSIPLHSVQAAMPGGHEEVQDGA